MDLRRREENTAMIIPARGFDRAVDAHTEDTTAVVVAVVVAGGDGIRNMEAENTVDPREVVRNRGMGLEVGVVVVVVVVVEWDMDGRRVAGTRRPAKSGCTTD